MIQGSLEGDRPNTADAEAAQECLLAAKGLGIYYPPDGSIIPALQAVAAHTDVGAWSIGSAQLPELTVAYFLGQEVACKVWRNSQARTYAMPFVGMDLLKLLQR